MNKKNPIFSLDPQERITNFSEVTKVYTKEAALLEAKRCLMCRNKPCVSGCPVGIDIPSFIKKIVSEDLDGAYQIITNDNLFPSICGRVCPQESQCEKYCIRGVKGESVAIGRLERFVGDNISCRKISASTQNNIKVAVVGSGPAGLTCSHELAKKGYNVTIYEALHEAGGVLTYGIPEFRLPKEIVKCEIDKLKQLGVDIITNVVIGKTLTIEQLFADGNKAIFLGSGAGLPIFMNIPGENLVGVFSANEFLTRINLMKAYEKESQTPLYPAHEVCVIGGGNVAMDAARCAKRLNNANVYIIYRRTEEEMPARIEEIHHAKEEMIHFLLQTNPVAIIGDQDGKVKAIECVKMTQGLVDESGTKKPLVLPNSNFIIPCDEVIMALGNHPNPLLAKNTPQLKTNDYGCIVVDENLMTSIPGVFAGGDAVSGAATVILAMGAGKKAASSIDEYIKRLS